MNKINLLCPFCNSKSIVKTGKRKNKNQTIQRYKCKSCSRTFTNINLKNKTYPAKIILNAISYYNLGYNQNEVLKKISSKFKTKVPQRTISEWLKEYKNICTFNKLRPEATKLYSPKNIIFSKKFQHIQPYTFKYNKAKLYLLFHNKLYNNQFHNISHFYEPLKNYLERIPTKNFPHHIFTYYKGSQSRPLPGVENNKNLNNNEDNNIKTKTVGNQKATHFVRGGGRRQYEQRASQLKFKHLQIKTPSKNNFACKLASLALNLITTNKDRHQKIQDFMLINDSTTIAVEVPVYLTNWDAGYYKNEKGFVFPLNNYKTPITGHIDILQIRNGLIHILDYKPEANKINATEQLTIYAMALSQKLNLPLYHIKAAWFDENNYYEFFPLHAVYEKQKKNITLKNNYDYLNK
jgi:transposase-like protein